MHQTSNSAVMCVRHSQIPATQTCSQCAMPVCDTCSRVLPSGGVLCVVCNAGSPRPAAPRPRLPMGSPIISQPCTQHPEVNTTRRCAGCGAHTCDTCDFALGGGVHICPTCAMNAPTGLSSGRKKLVIGGILLAIWSTAGFVLTMLGALANVDEKASGYLETLLILAPSMVGMGLSCSAQESRLHNPPVVWVGIIWNGLIMVVYLALSLLVLATGAGG